MSEQAQIHEPRPVSAIDALVAAIGYTQAQVASTCSDGHDMTPPQMLLDALDGVRDDRAALLDLCEAAWGIIANASGGDWAGEVIEWREAAARWRDRYHVALAQSRAESE